MWGPALIQLELRDEAGNILPTKSEHPWRDDCRRCGQSAYAINEYVSTKEGREIRGFADTTEQKLRVDRVVGELIRLGSEATLAEAVAVLQRGGSELAPVLDWIDRNRDRLLVIADKHGLALLGVILALLSWLFPRVVDQNPGAPVFEQEQIDMLIDEFRRGFIPEESIDENDDEAEPREPRDVGPERHGQDKRSAGDEDREGMEPR